MKLIFKRIAIALLALLAFAGAVVGIEYFGGHPMGLFSGSRPSNLGFNAGKFAPPSWKPNCVSSTADKSDETHFIAPLVYVGNSTDAWEKLTGIVKKSPRATVVNENAVYLYTEYKSAGMGYVDDVEFALDEKAGVIHVRSASRLGIRDMDVNRKRIESIRAQFGK